MGSGICCSLDSESQRLPVSCHDRRGHLVAASSHMRMMHRFTFSASLLETASESGESACLGRKSLVWFARANSGCSESVLHQLQTDGRASLEVNYRMVDSQAPCL